MFFIIFLIISFLKRKKKIPDTSFNRMKDTEIIIFIWFIFSNINSNLEYLLLLFNILIFIQNLGKQNHAHANISCNRKALSLLNAIFK